MESEHTQQNQEELEALKKERLKELKAKLEEEGFHPARIGFHATRILREQGVVISPEEPRGPDKIADIASELGYGALLLAALALERGK